MSLRHAASALVVCAAVLATPVGPASAQRGNPLIQQGSDLYDELRYEEALQVLSAALIRSGNSDQDRANILRFLAFTYYALGREEEAAGAYQSLLVLDSSYEPGSEVAPRVREFFSGVRARWEADGRPGAATAQVVAAPVEIRHRSPAQASRGEDVELRASVEDPSGRLTRLVVAYRQGTDAVFRRIEADVQMGEFVVTIPGDDVRPPLVEYYLEGLDSLGLPVASRGDVAAPLRIAVPEPGGSVLKKWWFWTGAAVIVGAVITTAVVASRSGGGGRVEEQGTLVVDVF